MVSLSKDDLDILAFSAFRYALGRKTYITASVSHILMAQAEHLEDNTRQLIIREIKGSIERGEAGMSMDADEWSYLAKYLEERQYEKKKDRVWIYRTP